ncbi:MAG: dihydrofolate reductase family protein [Myxococcota bacterium]
MPGRVRVFIACSIDGFIAGPDHDLSWLPEPSGDDHGFGEFFASVGALLMGRRTYEVAEGFDGPWPYEERPVLVATHRPIQPSKPTIRAVEGEITTLVKQAREVAGDRDVYLDGGMLIRQALDAGLVDEITLTLVPVILGEGFPLFTGAQRKTLELVSSERSGESLVQLVLRPIAS